VILTWPTCSQRSGMAVASNCRALAFYFSVRIYYKIPISQCRGESDLGQWMSSGQCRCGIVFAKTMLLRSADCRFSNVMGRRIRQNSPLCSGILLASPAVMHTPSSHSPLHFDVRNIYQNNTERCKANTWHSLPAAMSQCWPQGCRVKIMFGLLPNNWFVSTKMNSMKCFVSWIPLNTHVRSNQTQPYIKYT